MKPILSTLIITSYKEPVTAAKALQAAVNQTTTLEAADNIILCAPDEETLAVTCKYDSSVVTGFKDEGVGKAAAINQLLQRQDLLNDILILTDGDVYINDRAVSEILKPFSNSKVGCSAGRVIPTNDPTTKWGYMAHTLTAGAHLERQRRHNKGLHLEASGYLFAFRKSLIPNNQIPIDVAEDTIIPLLIKEQGYKTVYAPEAIVYVKYPENLADTIKQKVRTAKAHQNINKYIKPNNEDKMKSFTKELLRGIPLLIKKTVREISWTIQLMFLRLLIWYKARKEKGTYNDGWETITSTK